MNGNIQEKNGKYYCVLQFKGEGGKWKKKWFKTGLEIRGNKKKAQQMLTELLAKHEDEDFHKSKEILFVDYLKYWLEKKKTSKIEGNTWKSYEIRVLNHIIPYFVSMKLLVKDVKPKHILNFYEHKAVAGRLDGKSGGMSPRNLKYFSTIFQQVFKRAVMEEIILSNPALNISPPASDYEKDIRQFLDSEEAQKVIDLFDAHIMKPIVVVALYYGLRRSEILGLKWDAIDFGKGKIEVKRTVISYSGAFEERERTKNTSSRRTLGLIPEVKEILLRLKKEQTKNKMLFGSEYNDTDYIFTHADGHLIKPDYVTSNFAKVLKKSNSKRLRFHDLRHSCASLLKEKGMDIKDIQMWLGHSDIQTTGNIYTHITKLRSETIANSLAGAFTLNAV